MIAAVEAICLPTLRGVRIDVGSRPYNPKKKSGQSSESVSHYYYTRSRETHTRGAQDDPGCRSDKMGQGMI